MMIYYMVELWRLVSYQLRLSPPLGLNIADVPWRIIYHCNITALIQTKWCGLSHIYQPLSVSPRLSSRNPIFVSGCFIYSEYFISNISHFRNPASFAQSRLAARLPAASVRINMTKYCLWSQSGLYCR